MPPAGRSVKAKPLWTMAQWNSPPTRARHHNVPDGGERRASNKLPAQAPSPWILTITGLGCCGSAARGMMTFRRRQSRPGWPPRRGWTVAAGTWDPAWWRLLPGSMGAPVAEAASEARPPSMLHTGFTGTGGSRRSRCRVPDRNRSTRPQHQPSRRSLQPSSPGSRPRQPRMCRAAPLVHGRWWNAREERGEALPSELPHHLQPDA